MKIVNVDQSTPEWHAWRDEGITASEIACLFGTSPFKTLWQLWAEKSGLRIPDDLDKNPYVRRGKEYEQLLREKVSADRRLGIVPICLEHDQHTLIRASLDGIDHLRRPWELKIPSEGKFEEVRELRLESDSARTYISQVQHQLFCSGASEGFLVFGRVAYRKDNTPYVAEYIVLTIVADPIFHAEIVRKSAEFLNAVKNGIEPEKDPERDCFSPDTEEKVKIWRRQADVLVPLIDERSELKARLEEIDEQIKANADPVKPVLGDFRAGEFGGLRVLQVKKKGSFDWKEYMKSKGDNPSDEALISKFRKVSSASFQFKSVH